MDYGLWILFHTDAEQAILKAPCGSLFKPAQRPEQNRLRRTEELKKRQIKKIEQAAEQITAQPPALRDDIETAELKKAFRQSTGQEQNPTPAEQPQPPPG